jgi:hypothetical protein
MATETKAIAKTEAKAPLPANGGDTKAIAKRDENRALAGPTGEGWQVTETGDDRLYWHLSFDNPIKGRAIGTELVEQEDGERDRLFIKMQLIEPCMVVKKKEKDEEHATPFEAPAGSIVHVGIRKRLEATYKRVERSRFLLNLWIRPTRKVDVGRPQPMWDYKVMEQVTKHPRVIEVETEEENATPF